MDDAPRNETLGQRVRRLRQRQKLSVDRFARAADVSRNQVVSVEADATRNLRSDTLTRYAQVLGVPPEYVLTGLMPHEGQDTPPAELAMIYRSLVRPDQHALLNIGRALKESREMYQPLEMNIEHIPTERMAAFDEKEVEEHVRREEDSWPG